MSDSLRSPKKARRPLLHTRQKARELWDALEILRREAEKCPGLEELYEDSERVELRDAIRVILAELDSAKGGNLGIVIKRPPGRPREDFLVYRAKPLRDAGFSWKQIAIELGVFRDGKPDGERIRALFKSRNQKTIPDKTRSSSVHGK